MRLNRNPANMKRAGLQGDEQAFIAGVGTAGVGLLVRRYVVGSGSAKKAEEQKEKERLMSASKITPGIACSFLMTVFFLLVSDALGQEKAPEAFASYIEPNKNYRGERVVVIPPEEIEKYYKLVKIAATRNPKWYEEYSDGAKPGVPLPFHKNLNLTPKEYQEYLALWGKREFKVLEKMGVRLEQIGGKWRVLTTEKGVRISLLRYDEKADVFRSANGELKRIDDIDAAAETILGAWKGVEWRFEEETPLDRTKENFAIGNSADGKYAYIVYRLQEITAANTVLLDESKVIRIPLK
jgi:hypothetical protein